MMTNTETGPRWALDLLEELDRDNARALERIAASAAREPAEDVTIPRLLVLALRNELEAAECAAMWIASTPELDVKLALARQAGDEAKHFRLIERRLAELGVERATFEGQLGGPRSALLQYLATLPTTVERVAAGQFTREALALVRNEEFIRFCQSRGDAETAGLYRDVIQPDEKHHHDLGRTLLGRLATDESAQERARRAARKTLELAEELQEIARLKMGISRAPGC
jgi:1,2-phenylacetyl-CoA epoxidase catalytic subunit